MSQDLLIPINNITEGDSVESQTFADVMPTQRLPAGENYADDPDVMDDIRENLVKLMDVTRKQRQPLNDEWQAVDRMTKLIHDDGQRYKGRSNAYLPVFARMLQVQTSTLVKGIFPSDDYLDCQDRNGRANQPPQVPGMPPPVDRARDAKGYVQYELERNAKVRKHMKTFVRQLKKYGNSVLKVLYRKEHKYEGRSTAALISDLALAADPAEKAFVKVNYEGLQVSTRNLLNWYVYPMTADSISEATLVFEDMYVPKLFVETQGRLKRWKNLDAALNAPTVPEHELTKQGLQDNMGVSDSQESDSSLARQLTITEAWTFLKLPKSAYVAGEDPECPVSCCVILAGHTPVVVIRNPYFHQRPPYLFTNQNADPGMIYGSGLGLLAKGLQYQINDFTNQTHDTGSYSINPIVLRNPALMAGPQQPIRPGVVWGVTDTEKAIKFERPPVELIGAGHSMVQLLMNWVQELGGAPPQLGGSQTGGSKTATGMQILQRNALSPLQDEVEDIEQDIMVPLCYFAWYLGQQFRDKQVMALIAGQDVSVPLDVLSIDAEFRWLASSQAANSQMRNQQLMQFVQMAVPLVPILQMQGQQINFAPLLKRALGDGLGIRGIDNIIVQGPPPMMGAGFPGGQEMPPGAENIPPGTYPGNMPPEASGVASATDQAAVPTGDIVPGEAEAFADTRAEANEIAALLGSMGGAGG
jgi:hypothetical protein